MTIPSSVLVTGSNRGIGLHLVKKLLSFPEVKNVFAAVRDPAKAVDLQNISDNRLNIIRMDVEDDSLIESAVKQVSTVVGTSGLDVLINNAGFLSGYWSTKQIDRSIVNQTLNINTTGPLIVTQNFLPLLRQSAGNNNLAKVINISSMWGSIEKNRDGSGERGALVYKMSKAALNQMTRTLATDLKDDGIAVVSFCPGWVQTDMGGPGAAIEATTSADNLIASTLSLTPDHSGGFYDRNLKPMKF